MGKRNSAGKPATPTPPNGDAPQTSGADELPEDEELYNFKPSFDKDEMYKLESAQARDQAAQGQARRLVLATLTMSADELSEVSEKEQETYAEMRRVVDGFLATTTALQKLAQSASFRLDIADIGSSASTEVRHG